MKKLNRKNLNALAAVMPVLSENEQRGCVGGLIYMDSGGMILGSGGNSSDIYITDTLPQDFATNTTRSGNFSEQSDEIKQSVLRKVAYDLGVGKEGSDLEYVNMNFFGFTGDDATKDAIADPYGAHPSPDFGQTSYSGSISINTSDTLYQDCENYYDFQLTMIHEIDHIKTPEYYDKDKEPWKATMDEFTAYTSMFQSDLALEKCSDRYYNSLYNAYLDAYQKLIEEEKIDPSLIPLIGRDPNRPTTN